MRKHQVQRVLVCDEELRPLGVISLQDLAESEEEKDIGETVQQVKQGAPSIH